MAIVDQLYAWISKSPDWADLIPAIQKIRQRRLPSVQDTVSVKEVTIGESSPKEIREVMSWVKHQQAIQQKEFFINIASADVECLQIYLKDSQSLVGNGKTPRWSNLLEHLRSETSEIKLNIARPYESAVSLPVVFMFGGLKWSIHI